MRADLNVRAGRVTAEHRAAAHHKDTAVRGVIEERQVEGLGIGDAADATGLTVDTLRWYEREGIVPVAPRDSRGRRFYPPPVIRAIGLAHMLRSTGMPVSEVKAFMSTGATPSQETGTRLSLLEEHAVRVRERIAELEAAQQRIAAKTDELKRLVAAGISCEDVIRSGSVQP